MDSADQGGLLFSGRRRGTRAWTLVLLTVVTAGTAVLASFVWARPQCIRDRLGTVAAATLAIARSRTRPQRGSRR